MPRAAASCSEAESPLESRLVRASRSLERAFDRAFGQDNNPWRHLGSLAWFLFWVVAATGAYVFIAFDTSVAGAYASVERLAEGSLPLGRVARSLHRYASDAFALVVLLHLEREWLLRRYAHFRRFSWSIGVLALWLVYLSGIGGFWLVWDDLALYSLLSTTEWLDRLPLLGELSRNFDAADRLSDRFFSLLIFLHIGIPLLLLASMWVHVQRLSRPETTPPRALAWGTLTALVVLSVAKPVASGLPADAARAPAVLSLDWFYLGFHAFADFAGTLSLWAAVSGATVLLLALPWVSRAARAPRPAPAVVDLANCNGCARCVADCPYAAVTLAPRADGRRLRWQAIVDPALCAACGICAGACPSSTPLRNAAGAASGIDLRQAPVAAVRSELDAALERLSARAASGVPRIVVFGCVAASGGVDLAGVVDADTAAVRLLCAGQLPPSFVDLALRRGADGVMVTGCRAGDCAYRLGNRLTDERFAGQRRPRLRAPGVGRVETVWAGRGDEAELVAAVGAFRAALAAARAPVGSVLPADGRLSAGA